MESLASMPSGQILKKAPTRTDTLLFFLACFIELFLGLVRVCRRVPC